MCVPLDPADRSGGPDATGSGILVTIPNQLKSHFLIPLWSPFRKGGLRKPVWETNADETKDVVGTKISLH